MENSAKFTTRLIVFFFFYFFSISLFAATIKQDSNLDSNQETPLDEEFSTLEDQDFPDLVGVDEPGELKDEFDFLEEDVVYSAAKHATKIGMSPSAVILITKQEIEESGATHIAELLRRYPCLSTFIWDAFWTDILPHGAYYLLLLIDGREFNFDLFFSPFLGLLPVGIADLERIEIILGPNSALYGANAVAAVVNLITKKPGKKLAMDVMATSGEHATTQLSAYLSGGADNWQLGGTIGFETTDSWMFRSVAAKNILRVNTDLTAKTAMGTFSANASLVAGDYQATTRVGNFRASQLLWPFVQFSYSSENFKTRLYWSGPRNLSDFDLDFILPGQGIVIGSLPEFYMSADTLLAEAQYDWHFSDQDLLLIGCDFRFIHYSLEKESGEPLLSKPILEYRTGIFAHYEHLFSEQWLLSLGSRFDWNNRTAASFNPQLALVFNPKNEHYLRISGGTAFRKPTLLETLNGVQFEANPLFEEVMNYVEKNAPGNPNLDNELLATVELGYRSWLLDRRLRLELNTFGGLLRNQIEFTVDVYFDPKMQIDEERSNFGYSNRGRDTNIVGATFAIEGEPVKALTLLTRAEIRYHWYTDTTSRVPFTALAQSTLGCIWRMEFGMTLSMLFSYMSSHSSYMRDAESLLAPPNIQEIPGQVSTQIAFNYPFHYRQWNVVFGLNFFNWFRGKSREWNGNYAPNGSYLGGEYLDRKVLATVRVRY